MTLWSEYQASRMATISSLRSAFQVPAAVKTPCSLTVAGRSGSSAMGVRMAMMASTMRSTTASSRAAFDLK